MGLRFQVSGFGFRVKALQGYLTHKKQPPLRTLQYDYTQGPMVVLGGGAVSHERGIPARFRIRSKVDIRLPEKGKSSCHGARPDISMMQWILTSRLSI